MWVCEVDDSYGGSGGDSLEEGFFGLGGVGDGVGFHVFSAFLLVQVLVGWMLVFLRGNRGVGCACVGLVFMSGRVRRRGLPCYRDWETDRKSTRLNSSHLKLSRMPSSA